MLQLPPTPNLATPDLATPATAVAADAFAPDAFAQSFTRIIAGLAALIARAFLGNPRLALMIVPLHKHLTRTARRLAALMVLLARHGACRRRGEASGRGALAPRERTRSSFRIPTTPAWLVATLRHEAAAYASQLRHLLAQPGISALLDATPAARRLLRPICRMLGLAVTPRPAVSGQATLRQESSHRQRQQRSRVAIAGASRTLTEVPLHPESAPDTPPLSLLRRPPCPHVGWPWFPKYSPSRRGETRDGLFCPGGKAAVQV